LAARERQVRYMSPKSKSVSMALFGPVILKAPGKPSIQEWVALIARFGMALAERQMGMRPTRSPVAAQIARAAAAPRRSCGSGQDDQCDRQVVHEVCPDGERVEQFVEPKPPRVWIGPLARVDHRAHRVQKATERKQADHGRT